MRLYLKLALIVATAVLTQCLLRPAGRCAWELQFTARCWAADQLGDVQLRDQLVQEAYDYLVDDPRAAELLLATETPSTVDPAIPAREQLPDAGLPHPEQSPGAIHEG